MELTQTERIQVFRKRAGMNQADLGAAAFKTTPESGRTKIKNIELGKQKPTVEDIKNIADALDITVAELLPSRILPKATTRSPEKGLWVMQQTLDAFPGIREYLGLLNNSVAIGDRELMVYIAKKIAGIMGGATRRRMRV